MTPLEYALSAWIAFHAELGVEIEATFLPPATEEQIVDVETEIGYRLPEDLRKLYLIANGQLGPYGDQKLEGITRWAPLFGNNDFMSLDQAIGQYRSYLDMYQFDLNFRSKYNAANPDKKIEPIVWDVREGDPIDPPDGIRDGLTLLDQMPMVMSLICRHSLEEQQGRLYYMEPMNWNCRWLLDQ